MDHPGISTYTQAFPIFICPSLSTSIVSPLRQSTAHFLLLKPMATSDKPMPLHLLRQSGAALLVAVVAVAFLAGTCTAQPVTNLPPVYLSNVTVKNDLARTINYTIATNVTVDEGQSLAVYSESTLVGPNQSKQVPVGIPVGLVDGTLTVIIRVGTRSYNATPDPKDVLLSDLGMVTATVTSPCPGDNPPPYAIYVTVTTTTGVGNTATCLEPTSST